MTDTLQVTEAMLVAAGRAADKTGVIWRTYGNLEAIITAALAARPTVSGDAVERAIKLLEQTPIGDIGSNIRPRRSWEQKLDEVQEVIAGLRAIAALSTIDTPTT